uniref:Uncharacterized protein n=1 Tax=Oryza brachyantha TaxID=4533 RepID=J3M493_ORYBR
MSQVDSLLNLIEHLISSGLTSVWVTWYFIRRWIQPLKDQVHFVFDYSRSKYPTRETAQVFKNDIIMTRVQRLFQPGTHIPTNVVGSPSPFHAANAPPADHHQYLSYPPNRVCPDHKRTVEASVDEPAAKRAAFDRDVELPEAIEDGDAPVRSPSSPPLRHLRKPAFGKGSSNIDLTSHVGQEVAKLPTLALVSTSSAIKPADTTPTSLVE